VAATDAAAQTPPKSPLERFLSLFADVHAGEAAGALLLTLLMFLVLCSYYMLKTAREVFILSEGSAEVKSYASAGQAVLLLFIVPLYSAYASRVSRVQLVSWVTLFFASHVLLFMVFRTSGAPVGIAFFLWLGIFNVMVIAQFWAFANDLYSKDQGRRLFPLIGVGSSLGAWAGSVRAGTLMERAGPMRLLVGGAVILVFCVVIARIVDRTVRRAESPERAAEASQPVGEGPNGFSMLLADRYLLLIALLTLLLNVVNTSGEYLFGKYVVQNAISLYGADDVARGKYIGEAYSRFYANVNLVGLLLQMFVVSRVFRFLGVGRALFIHPIVAGGGYLMMLRAPSFEALRWLKICDNSIDYSLGNTTRQALWLPTSRQAKYKAKQAVDSFCVRAGDVVQAGMVYVAEAASLATPAFAAVNIVLTGVWIATAAALNRKLRER